MNTINHSQFNNAQASSSRQVNTPIISKYVATNNNQLLPCCKEIASRKAKITTNYNHQHRAEYYKNNNYEDYNYVYATRHGNTEYLERNLARNPANLNFYYKNDSHSNATLTLLHLAIIKRQLNTVIFLIQQGISLDITPNPLILACKYVCDNEIIHCLLSAGANPNYLDLEVNPLFNNDTSLHVAIDQGNIHK